VSDDAIYRTSLSVFVGKTLDKWAKDKKDNLEDKLQMNFEAVTNRDSRIKRWKKGEGKGWRSTTWIGFVRVKIWSFYSIFLDTVLKAGKIPFTLEASPYDEDYLDEAGIKDRDERIERMTSKIEHQLQARNADREYMQKWLSGAYYGMGFSAFDIEEVESTEFKRVDLGAGSDASQYLTPEEVQQNTRYELVRESENVPGHRYVSVWNMIWDMESSQGLQPKYSAGYAEIVPSSPYNLRELIEKPGYIKKAIELVIKNSTDDSGQKDMSSATPGLRNIEDRKNNIERRAFYMRVPKKLADEFQKKMLKGGDTTTLDFIEDYEEAETSGDDVEIMGEIADKEIIRYILNKTGKRPHKMWVVEQNLDESSGNGIADNMEDAQASLVGMIRSFEDNKKLSANITTAIKARYFNNPDQLNDIVPGKKYDIADSCPDVRLAILPIVYPDVGESLMSGIGLMMQLKDDVSMIPTILQGFTLPKHAPDTAFEMNELKQSAGKYIGQAIRNDDEMFIEPEIQDIYEYNMVFGEDERCKCNCKVKANGFTSFQNKEIRGLRMQQALNLFVTNEFLQPFVEVRPHLEIIYEAMDEDPDKFIKSEEQMAAEAKQRAEQQAQAEQKALQLLAAKEKLETQSKAALQDQEHDQELEQADQEHDQELEQGDQGHEQDMALAEQEHVHTIEEEVLKADLQQPKEAQ